MVRTCVNGAEDWFVWRAWARCGAGPPKASAIPSGVSTQGPRARWRNQHTVVAGSWINLVETVRKPIWQHHGASVSVGASSVVCFFFCGCMILHHNTMKHIKPGTGSRPNPFEEQKIAVLYKCYCGLCKSAISATTRKNYFSPKIIPGKLRYPVSCFETMSQCIGKASGDSWIGINGH